MNCSLVEIPAKHSTHSLLFQSFTLHLKFFVTSHIVRLLFIHSYHFIFYAIYYHTWNSGGNPKQHALIFTSHFIVSFKGHLRFMLHLKFLLRDGLLAYYESSSQPIHWIRHTISHLPTTYIKLLILIHIISFSVQTTHKI